VLLSGNLFSPEDTMNRNHKNMLEDMFGIRGDATKRLTKKLIERVDRAEGRVTKWSGVFHEMTPGVMASVINSMPDNECVENVKSKGNDSGRK